MGSKTPATQTVTNKTEVDPTTDAWRQAVFGAGTELYNQGPAEYFPGSTVAPFSQQTQAGLGMMQNQAAQGAIGLPQAYQSQFRAMSGFNPGMMTAQQFANGSNPYQQMMWNTGNANVAGMVSPMIGAAGQGLDSGMAYAPMIAQAGEQQTQMGVPQLQGFADAQNPYLDQLYQQGAEKVANSVNAQFSGAGRTGANAAHTGALAEGLGSLYTGIYAPAFESAQGRALSAASQLSGIDQANRAAQMSGYSSAAGLGLQGAGQGLQMADLYGNLLGGDAARRYGAASGLANSSMQGAGMAGDMWSQGNADASTAVNNLAGLYQYGGMPAQSMLGVGSSLDAYNQQMIDADMARWNYGQNANWDNLSRFAAMMNGLPDFSSTTQTTTGQQGGNRLMGAMGGGLGMYSALMMNPATAPFALLGGGLGALGGLF